MKKKFTDMFCGEPGSLHDARLLRKSDLYNKITHNPDFIRENILLACNWLVTPFKDNGALTQNQKIVNYKISSTRIIVEIAFGYLKGRFRRLRKLDNTDLMLCSQIIMVCCILHSI